MDIVDLANKPAVAVVAFKKRSQKIKNLKGDASLSSESKKDDEDVGVDTRSLADIKLEQEMRKRRVGTDAELVGAQGGGSKGHTESSKAASSNRSSIEAMMGSQFATQVGTGITGQMSHDNIMEQYVEKALGLEKKAPAAGYVFRYCY